jgi:hypothetical protein
VQYKQDTEVEDLKEIIWRRENWRDRKTDVKERERGR